tara:strand:- start:5672 stop:7078 length:1407 start_codon:yes stop_codon:yes gene_type:complete
MEKNLRFGAIDRLKIFFRSQIELLVGGRLIQGVVIGAGSKLIGFGRDFLIPNILGVSVTADLFVLVMRITLFVRSVIGDNLWISLFVPRLVLYLPGTSLKLDAERRLWSKAARGVLLFELVCIPVRILILMDCLFWNVLIVRSDFNQVFFYEISSLSFAPLLLGCIMLALLHSRNNVLSANSIAGWSNITFVALLSFVAFLENEDIKLVMLAASFTAAAILQVAMAKRVLRYEFSWRQVFAEPIFVKRSKRPAVQILLVAAGLSLQSLPSLLVSLAATSAVSGTITMLYLGQRLVMLFPMLVALPMASLMFPELSAVLKRAEHGEARKFVNIALLQGLLLSVIGCVLTFAAIWPVSHVIFMRSSAATAQLSAFYAVVMLLMPLIPLVFTMQILQRFLRANGADWAVFFSGLVGSLVTMGFIWFYIFYRKVLSIDELACALVAGTAATVIYMLLIYFSQKTLLGTARNV